MPVPRYTAAAHGDGGFQITDLQRGGEFRRYDGGGHLTEAGRPLQGLDGRDLGHRFVVERAGGGAHHIEITGGGYTQAPYGTGFQVTDGAGGFHRFAGDGTTLAHGTPVAGHPSWHLVEQRGAPPAMEVDAGFRVGPHAGAFQVDDVANPGRFERFDLRGNPTQTGRPVLDPAGQDLTGRTWVTHADGTPPHVEVHDPQLQVAAHPAGHQITDTRPGGGFVRVDGTGQVVQTGRPLTDAAGAVLPGRFVVTHAGGGAATFEAGAGFAVHAEAGGGVRITDSATGTFHRFDAGGTATAYGRPLPGHPNWYHVDNHGGPPSLEVPAGFQVAPHAGAFQVDDVANAGRFERFDLRGNPTQSGRPVRDPAGLDLPGHSWVTHADGTPPHIEVSDPQLQVAAHPAGHQITDTRPGGGFVRVDGTGQVVQTGRPLTDAAGAVLPGRFVVSHTGGGAATFEAGAGFAVHAEAGGGARIVDTAGRGAFHRFDGAGNLTHTGVRADDIGGHVDRVFVQPAGGGWHAENAAGAQLPHLRVQRLPGGDFRVTDTGGLRNGEYRVHNADGTLREQSFNVLRDGAPTTRQFVVDAPGRTWHLADGGTPVANPGPFQRGAADLGGAANGRVRLKTATGAEMFDRRAIPGTTQTLDVFRSVGGVRGGAQRPQWAKFDHAGNLVDHGVRRFDNSAVAWRDVSHIGTPSHSIRQTISPGEVIAVRDPLGRWTWTRLDAHGNTLGGGTRALDRDGGWTDRLLPRPGQAVGDVAQRQHGPWHGPDNAGMYREYGLTGGARTDTWQTHSPHGKDAGKLENLPAPGNATLETARWSEQRPPHWARRFLAGVPSGVFHAHGNQFLRTDTRFQVFTWTRTGGALGNADGFRFVSMSDAVYDVGRNGRFVRYIGKLEHGNTLKVGDDLVPLPAGAHLTPGRVPWTEGAGNLSGHRVFFPRGSRADGRVWEDRFAAHPAPGGDWYTFGAGAGQFRVARAGFEDGSIREFQRPPAIPAPGGARGGGSAARFDAFEGAGNPWTQRNIHGIIVGRRDDFPTNAPGGGTVHVEAHGPQSRGWKSVLGKDARSDTRRWTWTDGTNSGSRDWGRNFNGPHTTFDDSFRDLQTINGANVLVRERRMLDGGAYVDAWRVDNAAGGHHWEWRRVDKFGNVTAPGGATREWWNPRLPGGGSGWQGEWFSGATRFRDVTPSPGGPVLVRDIPQANIDAGLRRVREYGAGGDRSVWKEFDMGGVVRERTSLPGGNFLEKDAWRGQWRQYDGVGNVLARRDDAGWVYVPGAGRGLDLAGRELDYRGWASQIRGWNRRIREGNRMAWGGELPGGAFSEAKYRSYASHLAQKVALEFAQEFLLEFAANLVVNAIVDAIAGKQFNGDDVTKALMNAAVGSAVKSAVGSVLHENRLGPLQRTADLKAGLANIDGGKAWFRKPLNHDKHWSNEWAGNETATRWRGGTYDFAFNVPVAGLTGFVNGAMNASIFGVTNADGQTVYLHGGAAAIDGLIGAAAGLTGAVTTTIGKTLFNAGLGGRAFHRQGLAEFGLQLPWKIAEKLVTSQLSKAFRVSIDPWYFQAGGGA
ncbi:hypothetical protein AB0M46_34525 [Dactylosporangium sp. NPDC051485]|uniref:hypothetical protein n=1 Tax=Dactylosporangium sp. NPDC051485 TaxID=3154846 RepID=UPI00343EA484